MPQPARPRVGHQRLKVEVLRLNCGPVAVRAGQFAATRPSPADALPGVLVSARAAAPLSALDRPMSGCPDRAAGCAAAPPGGVGSGIGLQRFQTRRPHERSGLVRINRRVRRAPSARPPSAFDVRVARLDLPTARHVPAAPRGCRPGIRLQRFQAGRAHQRHRLLRRSRSRARAVPAAALPARRNVAQPR